MPFINQLIDYIRKHDFESIVVENDQALSLFRADGTSALAKECFTLTQINGFLNEILPNDRFRTMLAKGLQFRFPYVCESGAADIQVFPAAGVLRVIIRLDRASSTSALAALSHIAEPAPPSTPPANKETQPTTAAQENKEQPAPHAASANREWPFPQTTAALTKPASLRSHPDFPETNLMPERRLRTLAVVAGVILGLVTSLLIYLLANKDGMLGHMFNLRSLPSAIPVSISLMFFWAAAACCLRWLRLRRLERISSRSLLLHGARILSDSESPAELAEQLKSEVSQTSPLLRRLRAVLQQWLIRPDLQDADLVLQQHVANDEEAVRAGYNLVRTFVWALPVLGLIGTVIGISLAVGEFASFLGGNIDDVGGIKKALVGVTGGLSFAFLITLQGLLTSLLVMLAASALQTREEKLYAAIQQNITDDFLPVLQRVAPEPKSVMDAEGAAALRETLQQVAQEVLKKVGDECLQIVNLMDARQTAQAEQVTGWTQAWQREMAAGAGHLEQVFGRLVANQSIANHELLERLSSVRDALSQHAAGMREFSENQNRAAAQNRAETAAAMSEQTRAVQAITETFSGLTETTKAALECQTALQTAVRQLVESKLDHTFTGLREAFSAQSHDTQAMMQAVAGLNKATDEALRSQATLQMALRQLHETGLTQTMAEFRDSLLSLRPVLAGFREPFVLQAVPLAGKSRNEGGDGALGL